MFAAMSLFNRPDASTTFPLASALCFSGDFVIVLVWGLFLVYLCCLLRIGMFASRSRLMRAVRKRAARQAKKHHAMINFMFQVLFLPGLGVLGSELLSHALILLQQDHMIQWLMCRGERLGEKGNIAIGEQAVPARVGGGHGFRMIKRTRLKAPVTTLKKATMSTRFFR